MFSCDRLCCMHRWSRVICTTQHGYIPPSLHRLLPALLLLGFRSCVSLLLLCLWSIRSIKAAMGTCWALLGEHRVRNAAFIESVDVQRRFNSFVDTLLLIECFNDVLIQHSNRCFEFLIFLIVVLTQCCFVCRWLILLPVFQSFQEFLIILIFKLPKITGEIGFIVLTVFMQILKLCFVLFVSSICEQDFVVSFRRQSWVLLHVKVALGGIRIQFAFGIMTVWYAWINRFKISNISLKLFSWPRGSN